MERSGRRTLSILLLLGLAGGAAGAEPGTEAAPFLATEVGARGAAMGGAWTALADGAAAVAWNPAALGTLGRGEIAGLHLETPFGENYEFLGYARPVGERWGVGVSGIYLYSVDAIRTEFDDLGQFTNASWAVSVAAGRRLTDRLSVGLAGKYVRERLFTFDADALALDAGVLYADGPFSVGAAVLNYGSKIRFVSAESPLPLRLRVGTAYRRGALRLAMESILAGQTKPGWALGAEYEVVRSLVLRGGYRLNHDGRGADAFTAGAEFRLEDLSARYAYVPLADVGAAHRIEIAYALGPRPAAAPGETAPAAPAPRVRRRLPPKIDLFPDIGLRGTWTAGYRRTSIDNAGIIGRPPGGFQFLDYTAVGGTPNLNLALSASLQHDRWDRFEPRRVQANARTDRFEATAGHLVTSMTDLTFTPQEVLGVEGRLDVDEKPLESLPAPEGGLLHGRAAGRPFSVGKWYRERGVAERPRSARIRAFGGRTARAVNVGDRIPFQNGDRSTFGVFDEYSYGVVGHARVHPLVDVGLRVVRVEDDPASLHSAGTTRPQASTTASLTALWRAPTGLTDIGMEYAWSDHDPDRWSAEGTRRDWAGYLLLAHRFPSRLGRRLEVRYERLGDEFEALGAPLTRTRKDRGGVRGFFEWPFRLGSADGFLLRLDGEQYDNNLGRRLPITTRTRDGKVTLGWASPTSGWSLRTSVQARTDFSDETPDTTESTRRVSTRNEIVRVDLRGPVSRWVVLDAGYGRSRFENRSLFSSGAPPSAFATTTYRAGLSSRPGTLGRGDLGFGWNEIRTLFTGTTVSRTVTDIWNARAGWTLSEKIRTNAFASWMTVEGPTQQQIREEVGGNARVVLSTDRAVQFEYRRFRDKYEPVVPDLEHEGYSVEMRLTSVF